jgi:hypothetical protein
MSRPLRCKDDWARSGGTADQLHKLIDDARFCCMAMQAGCIRRGALLEQRACWRPTWLHLSIGRPSWQKASAGSFSARLPSPCILQLALKLNLTCLKNATPSCRWIEDLRLGRVESFAEIAEREALGERHIRLLTPLAFVSPRIVAAIIEGAAPTDLTVTGLAKALPYSWAEQEQRVSVTSRTAVYGPVRTVVWEGRSREAPPYPY